MLETSRFHFAKIVLLSCVLCGVATAKSSDNVVSNFDFLKAILENKLQQELQPLFKEKNMSKKISLFEKKENRDNWIMENILIDMFHDYDYTVFTSLKNKVASVTDSIQQIAHDSLVSDPEQNVDDSLHLQQLPTKDEDVLKSEAVADNILEYSVMQNYVDYTRMWRDGIFGDKKILRAATVQGNIRIVSSADNKILFNTIFEAHEEDTVLFKYKDRIEQNNRNLVRKESTKTFWKNALELIIASGSVGLMMYLLFTQSF